MKKNNKGFSLVELIVVIAIMAILAAIAIPTFSHFIKKAHEASDDELLHNINYIFSAACLENGVDVKEVTNATWSMDDMLVTSVKVNGVENAKIVESFETHFDLIEEEFFYIKAIYFDKDVHAFVASDEEVFMIGGTQLNISEEYLTILRGDNAFSDRGAEALLNDVGTLDTLLKTGIGDAVLTSVKQGDDFLRALGGYAGLTQGADESDDDYLDRVLAYSINPENADAVYNAQIMYAASSAANVPDDQINSLFTGTVTSNITVKNDDGSTNSEATMANAALAYGMYTAYLQQNNLDATVAGNGFTDIVNSDAFKTYCSSAQGKTDLEAYQAALNIVGDNTDNSEVTGSILENGIDGNEELEDLMIQIMGK